MIRHRKTRQRVRESAKDGCRGWVYVIDNEGFSGRVKIGYTLGDPVIRARSLQDTGHAFPNVVQYHALVDNPHRLERKVHQALARQRQRGEWFEVLLIHAIAMIREKSDRILFEDETPRWHPAVDPPTETARTRLQREREEQNRADNFRDRNSQVTRGDDILQAVWITAEMARKGCHVPAKSPKEGLIKLLCPAGATDGAKLTAKGMGYFSLTGGPRGDLIVQVRIR